MRQYILFYFLFFGFINVNAQKEITLQNLWQNKTYATKSIPGFNFMNDGQHYTRLENNNILQYDFTSGKMVKVILESERLKSESFTGQISSYSFNEDESKIIIASEKESIYRRSSKAYFFIYDLKSQKLNSIREEKIMYATLNSTSDLVAYVFENNLYYYNLKTKETKQVTQDGKKNKIINGSADWVYEEEFYMSKAFYWSPNGEKIAFLRFDESEVPEFTMTLFKDEMYPTYETFKYPKVGEKNAIVTCYTYDINTGKSTYHDVQDQNEHYIPRINWVPNSDELVVTKINRHQNHLQLLIFNAKTNSHRILLEEKNKYYIKINEDFTFLKHKNQFIWASEKEGYNQLYLYNYKGELINKITKGDFDVTDFYGVDEKRGLMYYASKEESPLENHIYAIELNGENKKKISTQTGTNTAQFSSTFDYYVITHSNVTTPPNYRVYNHKQKEIRVIEDNSAFANHLQDFGLNPIEFFTFSTQNNVELNGYMIKPSNFDSSNSYPVFMTQYSGPGSQKVLNKFGDANYWWYQMLAQRGYLIVCVDPRGTGGRGEEFKKMTYLQLGKYETIDQIEAAKYIGSLPFADADRIGIFGWSYGGYMSTLCISKGADVFKSAIAVAPVTNWKWYDAIYTERYMRTYKENEAGYDENSPIYFADLIKGNYLLVHGLGDDNVHWQNSAEMTASLIKSNIQFDTQVYPNMNHSINGTNARHHLYTKMNNFVLEKI